MRLAAALLLTASLGSAQTGDVRLVPVAKVAANPTEILAPNDGSGRLFVVNQQGRISVIRNGEILSTPFLDWASRVSCCGERGLLGLAFPPDFSARRYFYINYTDRAGNTVVSRLHVSDNPDRADPASEQVVLTVAQPFPNHNGGHLAFGPDGYLYIGMGDGGSAGDPMNNGQSLNALLGKMLRIDTESGVSPYASPVSNPFNGQAGARPEIWAYGLRNPWKFSFDRQFGNLYIADVGQDRTEEVNYQPASSKGGENYGWNRTEGLDCYRPGCDRNGITMPVAQYSHSEGISVTGGYVYRGNAIPALSGAYIYGDFGSGRMWSLRNTASGWQNLLLLNTGLQISTFGEDASGELYLGSYADGTIYRLTSTASAVSVVNSASLADGVAPGSLATIFGNGIAPVVGVVQASSFPLPATLAGVSVSINGQAAPMLAVAAVNGREQINFQVPYELAGSNRATLMVNTGAGPATSAEISIAPAQPEIFLVTRQTGLWVIWATGLGAVTDPPSTGQSALVSPLSRTVADTQVRIGGIPAQVTYSGLAPTYAGLYQVNVVPPEGASSTSEVVLSVGGAASRPWRASGQ